MAVMRSIVRDDDRQPGAGAWQDECPLSGETQLGLLDSPEESDSGDSVGPLAYQLPPLTRRDELTFTGPSDKGVIPQP